MLLGFKGVVSLAQGRCWGQQCSMYISGQLGMVAGATGGEATGLES